jgi:hypothetical protein
MGTKWDLDAVAAQVEADFGRIDKGRAGIIV